MKHLRKLTRSPWMTALLFLLAAGLLLGGSIGGARAALNITSDYYSAGVEMYDIGVTLMEKCQNDTDYRAVSWRNYLRGSDYAWDETNGTLLSAMLGENEQIQIGKTYSEELAVLNSGAIDTFVRVKVYAYWEGENASGQVVKRTDLDPSLIDVHFVTGNGWMLDSKAPSPSGERTVLYYGSALAPGQMTTPFVDSIGINGRVLYKVNQTVDGNKIINTYDYDGQTFRLEAEVDAVQTHNAQSAILSAWGRSVTVAGNGLSLN